jgi:large exoprotein involved in heme utilization and adhesion
LIVPGIDLKRDLYKLLSEPIYVTDEPVIIEGCQTGEKQASEFFNTGRGGLPPNPYEPISSSNIWEDVPPPTDRTASSAGTASTSASPATPPHKIVEAQGWLINEKGEVVLVAQMPVTHSQSRCRLR